MLRFLCAVHGMWYYVNEVEVAFVECTLLCPWALSSFFSGVSNVTGNSRHPCTLSLSLLYCCFNYTGNSTGYTWNFPAFGSLALLSWVCLSNDTWVKSQLFFPKPTNVSAVLSDAVFCKEPDSLLRQTGHYAGKHEKFFSEVKWCCLSLWPHLHPQQQPLCHSCSKGGRAEQSCHVISGTAPTPGSHCARYCLCRNVTSRERTKSSWVPLQNTNVSPCPSYGLMGQSFKFLK